MPIRHSIISKDIHMLSFLLYPILFYSFVFTFIEILKIEKLLATDRIKEQHGVRKQARMVRWSSNIRPVCISLTSDLVET